MNKLKFNLRKLLHWSEKYIKTDMLYLVKGGFWLSAKQVINALLSLLLTIGFANLLPKEIYGTYKYIVSFAGLMMIFSLYGMYTAIVRATAQGKEGSFWPAIKTRIYWSMIGSMGTAAAAIYYYYLSNNVFAIGFAIATIFIPFFESLFSYDAVLIGRKNFKQSSVYQIISRLFTFLIIIGALYLTQNLFWVIFAYFFSYSISRAIFVLIIAKKYALNQEEDTSAISYGKHLSFVEAIGVVAKYVDKILVFHYIGAVELAIYSFATAPVDQISSVLANIQTLALPKYSQGEKEKIKLALIKKMVLLGIAILAITIIYFFISPAIFKLAFPKYLESISYTKIYVLSLITAVGTLPIALIQGQKNIKAIYKYNVISSILSITILFFSVKFGLIGVIIARVINRFVNLFYLTYLAKKH